MKTNKQLKAEYKEQKPRMGIYQICNTINGKIPVGSSLNLDAIWNRIQAELRFIGHRNTALQQDWTALGAEAFSFEVLSEIRERPEETANYARELQELEQLYIAELKPFGERGYNIEKS